MKPPKCKRCPNPAQYYGPEWGYSVRCQSCNEKQREYKNKANAQKREVKNVAVQSAGERLAYSMLTAEQELGDRMAKEIKALQKENGSLSRQRAHCETHVANLQTALKDKAEAWASADQTLTMIKSYANVQADAMEGADLASFKDAESKMIAACEILEKIFGVHYDPMTGVTKKINEQAAQTNPPEVPHQPSANGALPEAVSGAVPGAGHDDQHRTDLRT